MGFLKGKGILLLVDLFIRDGAGAGSAFTQRRKQVVVSLIK